MLRQAFFLAAIWGTLPLALFSRVEPTSQLILACLMVGMMSGGAFTLSTFPRAGLVYLATDDDRLRRRDAVVRCRSLSLTAVFLLLFAFFMARNIVSQGNLFLGNLKAQLELERQTEIISLLLKDFQENASDWLWQTDAEGHLVDVPATLRRRRAIAASAAEGIASSPTCSTCSAPKTRRGLQCRRPDGARRTAARDEFQGRCGRRGAAVVADREAGL